GNRSNTIDPGEAVDLVVTIQNAGSATASGVTATLASSTPGVTITNGSSSFAVIAPGASVNGATAYRIALTTGVACGTPIALTLTPSASGVSCPLETSTINLEMGLRTPVITDDAFETATGWAHNAASSTASTGAWTRGDPIGTNYQPEDDNTPAGSACWYTATNPSASDSQDDVDTGVVTLLSPVFNLSALSTARISYFRWFGQRDLGDDGTGDFFKFEVSNNGGTAWSTLETIGDTENASY